MPVYILYSRNLQFILEWHACVFVEVPQQSIARVRYCVLNAQGVAADISSAPSIDQVCDKSILPFLGGAPDTVESSCF